MKKKWMLVSVLVLVLVLMGGIGLVLARGGLPGLQRAPRAPLDNGFTYQGELIRDTTPVSETCDMAFRLYDASSSGLQVGAAITTSVDVVDGLFTAPLDFGASAFAGEARWLDIAVKCSGDSLFTAFPERLALTAAPYALYAKTAGTANAAPWSGLTGVPVDFADDADADASNELNDDMALVDSTLYLTDTGGTLSADLSGLAGGGGGDVKQLVQDFVMAGGENVSVGDLVTFMNGETYDGSPKWSSESVFNANTTNYIGIAALSATDFVATYRDQDNANYGTAIAGTLNDGNLTWGSESVFNTAVTYDTDVNKLSATDFVVVYRDEGNFNYGTAITGALNGSSLTWGSASVFTTAATYDTDVNVLSPTDFVVVYRNEGNSDYGTAIIGTLNGGNLTWGSESVFNAAATYNIGITALSPTNFVIAYQDDGNSSHGTAITGTLDGGNFTWGSGSVFNTARTYDISIAAMPVTGFVVAYRDEGNANSGTVITGALNGGSLTWGSESVFDTAIPTNIGIIALSATDFVVAYRDGGNSNCGTVIAGTLDGSSFTWDSKSVFNSAVTTYINALALSTTDFMVVYRDEGNSKSGTVRVSNRIRRRLIGTARNTAGGGQTVTVIIDGVSDAHTGLTPGTMYYRQDDGSLGATPTAERVGLAVSSTELLLDQLW